MKKTLKLMMIALLAFGMFACGEKKLTQEDLKAAEATLMGENWTMNMDVAPKVAKKYCQFVEQNPDDPTAPMWLFHAVEIHAKLNNVDKSIELADQLIEQYPDSRWAPQTLFLMANFVYDGIQHDLDKAKATYEQLINDYPDSELVDDAQKSIEYLGLSPEEIMTLIMMSQMEVEEETEP